VCWPEVDYMKDTNDPRDVEDGRAKVWRWSRELMLGCLRPLLSLRKRLDLFEGVDAWVSLE
jgi:hypothetical protein